jgi:hypothetical protein
LENGSVGSIRKLSGKRDEVQILQTAPRENSRATIHLAVDSSGLKIFEEGEWLEEKHKTKGKRRSWRKLHLGLEIILPLPWLTFALPFSPNLAVPISNAPPEFRLG